MDDYVDYLKAPIGTWDGKTYRISIDGDTHTFAYRTDYYADQTLKDAWTAEGHAGDWAPPTTWEQVNEQSKFLAGKKDPLTGLDAYGIIDPLKYSGAASASTSWKTAPWRTRSIPTARPGCSTPRR